MAETRACKWGRWLCQRKLLTSSSSCKRSKDTQRRANDAAGRQGEGQPTRPGAGVKRRLKAQRHPTAAGEQNELLTGGASGAAGAAGEGHLRAARPTAEGAGGAEEAQAPTARPSARASFGWCSRGKWRPQPAKSWPRSPRAARRGRSSKAGRRLPPRARRQRRAAGRVGSR